MNITGGFDTKDVHTTSNTIGMLDSWTGSFYVHENWTSTIAPIISGFNSGSAHRIEFSASRSWTVKNIIILDIIEYFWEFIVVIY